MLIARMIALKRYSIACSDTKAYHRRGESQVKTARFSGRCENAARFPFHVSGKALAALGKGGAVRFPYRRGVCHGAMVAAVVVGNVTRQVPAVLGKPSLLLGN
jgi:hypothetical protein